jgi:hypothetical protein
MHGKIPKKLVTCTVNLEYLEQKVRADSHVNKCVRAESYSVPFQSRSHLETCLFPHFSNILISGPKSPKLGFSCTVLSRILYAHTFRFLHACIIHRLSHLSSFNHLYDY